MIIPHLLFAHLLGDYPLQSHWLVTRKGKAWDGLVLHGAVVGFISLLTLAYYVDTVWLALLVMTVLHTGQDYLKVYLGPRLKVHPFIPYLTDQALHYLVIGGVQLWVGSRITPEPGAAERAFMWTGAAVIAVTRYYEVTWWANWLDMIPYMKRWRTIGYLERVAIMALAAAGLWMVAPLGVIPRLLIAYRRRHPIWKERHGLLEIGIAIVLSVAVGIGLGAACAQI